MRTKMLLVLFVCLAFVSLSQPAPSIRCIGRANKDNQWSMDCSSLNATYFKKYAFSPVYNLTLAKNNIVEPQLANWPDLRYLDLSYNRIANLTNATFSSCVHIEHLNISRNHLKAIGPETFSGLSLLRVLDLSFNPILGENLGRYHWDSLRKPLSSRLKELYLISISLDYIPEDAFKDSTYLRVLDLSRNNLKELPVFPETLVYLDLSFNVLEVVPVMPFESSARLRYLSFDNNTRLTKIEEGAFGRMTNLSTLSLRGCVNLAHLPKGMLRNNTGVKNLSLAGCNLTSISPDMGPLLLKMDLVEVHANPWACNYSMKWFTKLNTPVGTSNSIRCSTPSNVTVEEFMEPTLTQRIVRYGLIAVSCVGLCCLFASLWVGYGMEKKRREKQHYSRDEKDPLYANNYDLPPQHPDAIYISTVAKK